MHKMDKENVLPTLQWPSPCLKRPELSSSGVEKKQSNFSPSLCSVPTSTSPARRSGQALSSLYVMPPHPPVHAIMASSPLLFHLQVENIHMSLALSFLWFLVSSSSNLTTFFPEAHVQVFHSPLFSQRHPGLHSGVSQ